MENLVDSMGEFLAKTPGKRFGELMAILNHQENDQTMGALSLIFPCCSEDEQAIISQNFPDDTLEASDLPLSLPLIKLFFADAQIEAGPEAISDLCCSLLGHQNSKLRKNTLSLLDEGIFAFDEHTKCQLILMLGDPEEKIRELVANTIPFYANSEDMLPERFFTTFYMKNIRYGKSLAEDIETHEGAVMFLYLCFAHSEKGHVKSTDSEFSSTLITSLYSSLSKSKIYFPEVVSDALELFCARTTSLQQLTKKDKAMIKKEMRDLVHELVNTVGGNFPNRLPRPSKTPLVPKEKVTAKA